MTEIRKQKLVGSNHVRHAIFVDGVEVYAQLSPFSEDEIEKRVQSFLNPAARILYNMAPNFVPGSCGTAKSYGAKGGKAGRRPKAAAGAEPWEPSGDE